MPKKQLVSNVKTTQAKKTTSGLASVVMNDILQKDSRIFDNEITSPKPSNPGVEYPVPNNREGNSGGLKMTSMIKGPVSIKGGVSGMDDPLKPTTGVESGIFSDNIHSMSDMGMILQANNIYNRRDMALYDKFSRFGILDPYNSLAGTKEYLFFTKPDLHICKPGTHELNKQLSNSNFFTELAKRYPQVIGQLQKSTETEKSGSYNPFMTLLSNTVKSKLDMPGMDAKVIDTGATIFGTSIDYRGDAFNSGEKYEFSLEFEDTKYLELYHFFKAMEEYAQLKKIGIVTPPNINNAPESKGYAYSRYLEKKELHDQFSIFKFIVDDDYQDIIYYAMFVGVFTKSTPREAFSDINPDGGLRYNVQFEAQFVDDMKPYILDVFNGLINDTMVLNKEEEWLDIYNGKIGEVDGRWAKTPYVVRQEKKYTNPDAWLAPQTMEYKYQLRWRLG